MPSLPVALVSLDLAASLECRRLFGGFFDSGSREIIQDPGLDWNKIWLIQLEYHIGIRSCWISTILGYHKILDSLIPLMVVFPSVSSILFPNFLPSCSKFISAKELVCIKPSWGFGPRNPWRFGLPAAVRPLKHLPKMVISLVFVASIMVPNGRMLPEPQNPRTPEPQNLHHLSKETNKNQPTKI